MKIVVPFVALLAFVQCRELRKFSKILETS